MYHALQGVQRKLILGQAIPLPAAMKEQREDALIRRMMRVDNWLVDADGEFKLKCVTPNG